MDIQTLIETFGNDPNLHLLPLPASVRKALNKPEEPEPNPCDLNTIAQKAIFDNSYEKFEERPYPKDIPFPDMEKMAKELQEQYGLIKDQIATIKEVVSDDTGVGESKED